MTAAPAKIAAPSTAVRNYVLATVVLFVFAAAIASYCGYYQHKSFPYNTFLFDPDHGFSDLSIFKMRMERWAAGGGFYGAVDRYQLNYPPAAFFVLLLLFAPGGWQAGAAVGWYVAFTALCWAAALFWLLRSLDRLKGGGMLMAACVAGLALSYPVMFAIDRANIEVVPVILSGLGALSFARRRYGWAGVLFGASAAIKIVPAILFLLLLNKRRFKETALGMGLAVLLNVSALAVMGPGIGQAYRGFMVDLQALDQVTNQFLGTLVGFDHSLFSLVKQADYFIYRLDHPVLASGMVTLPAALPRLPYMMAAAALFGAAYWFRIRRLPFLNQLMALVVCQVLLPPVSFDYTLMHLYIPWSAFLIFLAQERRSEKAETLPRAAMVALLPFAILFTPQSYCVTKGIGWVAYGGQVKAFALLLLLVAALRCPMRSLMWDPDAAVGCSGACPTGIIERSDP